MMIKQTEEELFQSRHIGPGERDLPEMLKSIGVGSLDELINETVPKNIRLQTPLNLQEPLGEYRYLQLMRDIARRNKVFKSYIGLGYYNCVVPPVIQRNILENPGWYTQYTPYQSEIAQGRLEGLVNFQTMVVDMTAMEVASASLLDEGTAAAEAMTMAHSIVNRRTPKASKFFVSETCFPQTIDVLRTRATPLGIELVISDHSSFKLDSTFFGTLVQYPAEDGAVHDYRSFIRDAKNAGSMVVIAADLLSLAILTPPGELGADIAIGNSQRFGVPLGFGGPHAAYFAAKNEYIRSMPGRIIGVSIDAQNTMAYRMTLQTREQHIRREKATSNICTNHSLCALTAAMYLASVGSSGMHQLAMLNHDKSEYLKGALRKAGFKVPFESPTFNEFVVVSKAGFEKSYDRLLEKKIVAGLPLSPFYPELAGHYLFCVTEMISKEEMDILIREIES